MIDARVFDELAQTISKFLPPGLADAKDDFERNAKSAIQSALGNLDMVTREEFDVQTEVLRNTRNQLKTLEKRLNELESQPKESGTGE